MEKRSGSDIDNALELFIGDTKGQKRVPERAFPREAKNPAVPAIAETKPRPKSKPTKLRSDQLPQQRKTTSWIGRLPGHKSVNHGPKSKTTLRIDAELMDEFRERVFVERRPLGEIIEDAMRFHKRKNWKRDA